MARLPTRPVINRGLIAETGQVPSGMQLIQDTHKFVPLSTKTVLEYVDGKETNLSRITGLFQLGDAPNANGRVYPTRDVLVPAVRSIQEDVDNRSVYGEFDHPADAKIHLDRISHLITKIWMEGNKVYGEAEVIHRMPCGAMLKALFEHNGRVGISSRGVGDMEVVEHADQELYRVLPGYAFVTWDVVAEPSVRQAIMHLKEGVERRIGNTTKSRNAFPKETYEAMLVEEINKHFNAEAKTITIGRYGSYRK